MAFSRRCDIDDSSHIVGVDYNPAESKMRIFFKSGGTYIYSDVHPDDFGKLISAESPGKAFHSLSTGKGWKYEKACD